jgi:hypothetical protein
MILEKIFDSVNISVIICTILIFIGWITRIPSIFSTLSFIVKTIVGIYLVIKFSGVFPSLNSISPFDKKICLVSGMYILVFTLGDYIHNEAYKVRPWVLPIIEKILPIKPQQ